MVDYPPKRKGRLMDTIVAQATAIGRGSVGIVRISGPLAQDLAKAFFKKIPPARSAEFLPFYDENDRVIDQGIAIYFASPHSFTGEDVLELQGHGGPLVMDLIIQRALKLGARLAKPGEFSERAFLNDKLDLAQAEAIADLINASSEQAARSAIRSLQGEFSEKINHLVESLIYLRMYVEAAIDFPEEEIDFLADNKITELAIKILEKIQELGKQAKQGSILREGMTLVIAGKPNAGKSSLLNALAQREAAIVTEIAGTTRDILKEAIHIDGVPLHIIDTAGLRDTQDIVEREGIRRAKQAISEADRILLVVDVNQKSDLEALLAEHLNDMPQAIPLT
ncbi:MAG: tRNA modification GTPase TrmE, partial [Gammaproteobacteria bacterium]|nr:tRNA modification GTPase TrmE [Gammaproteobacteria bacterium]